MKRVVFSTIIIVFFLLVGTLIAVLYAKGYRITPGNGNTSTKIKGTGLLVATSKPDGAKVLVNNELKTATDNTINLAPGEYEVVIEKDGYFPWKKKTVIKKEEVSRADAILFPTVSKLENITTLGASDPILDPTGSLLAYTVASVSAQKNGVYVFNMNGNSLLNTSGSELQIASNLTDTFSIAHLSFSPDGQQLIASISGRLAPTVYLLSTKNLNATPQNVSVSLPQIMSTWNTLKEEQAEKLIKSQDEKLAQLIKEDFKNFSFSPEHDKILYEASGSALLPLMIDPRLIGVNSTPEERNIKAGNTYVYDIKEDRNYLIFDASILKKNEVSPIYFWHPFSRHLIFVKDKKIHIMEFDGQNDITIYAGPFLDDYVFPWPNGGSLVILTNYNLEKAPYNLYRLSLK